MRRIVFVLALLPLLLAACAPQGITYSQDVALMHAAQQIAQGQQGIIDGETFQVRQTVQAAGLQFALITYSQQSQGRQEECLMVFEVRRNLLGGWESGSGGGGCGGPLGDAPADKPAMDVGGGSGSGSKPGDLGYSHVNGAVNQAEIKRVRVTWGDHQAQVVDVINGTYLVVRPGRLQFDLVEGLNEAGEVIFSHRVEKAPGKS